MSMLQQIETDAALRPLSLDEIDSVSGGAKFVVTKVIMDLWGVSVAEGTLDGVKGVIVLGPDGKGTWHPFQK
jgi:hypothetical protein